MAIASPLISVEGQSAGQKYEATPTESISASIANVSGIRTVTWDIYKVDDTLSASAFTLSQSGSVGQTVTFSWPSTGGASNDGFGTACVLRAIINGGINSQGVYDLVSTTGTVKLFTNTSGGYEVICVGEEMESDSVKGYAPLLNNVLRTGGVQGPPGEGGKPVFVNVKDDPFLAVGDGITNDTAAIQSAINYVNGIAASTGTVPTLFFPSGTYWVKPVETVIGAAPAVGAIHSSESIRIVGDGMHATTIFSDAQVEDPIFYYFTLSIAANKSIYVENIGFVDSIGPTNPNPGGGAISTERGPHSAILAQGYNPVIELTRCMTNGPNGGFITVVGMAGGSPVGGTSKLRVSECILNYYMNAANVYCGGNGNWMNLNVPSPATSYDVELHAYRNEHHCILWDHGWYIHPSVSIICDSEVFSESDEYPNARNLGCYYRHGAGADTSAKPPRFLSIRNATFVRDTTYAIRNEFAFTEEDVDTWITAKSITTSTQSNVASDGSYAGVTQYPMLVVLKATGTDFPPGATATVYGYDGAAGNAEFGNAIQENVVISGAGLAGRFYTKTKFGAVTKVDIPAASSSGGTLSVGNGRSEQVALQVANCQFLGCTQAIQTQAPMIITGGTIDHYGKAAAIHGIAINGGATPLPITISGMTFKCAGKAIEVYQDARPYGGKMSIIGCHFHKQGAGNTFDGISGGHSFIENLSTSTTSPDFQIECVGTTFDGDGTGGGIITNNSLSLLNCSVRGNYTDNRFVNDGQLNPGATLPTYKLLGNEAPKGTVLLYAPDLTTLPSLIAANNLIESDGNTVINVPEEGSCTSTVAMPMSGEHPTALTVSGNAISPPGWQWDTFQVSGAGVIKNIYFDGYNRGFTGRIYLYGASGWSTDDTGVGNGRIVHQSSAARGATDVVTLQFIQDTSDNGYWVEVPTVQQPTTLYKSSAKRVTAETTGAQVWTGTVGGEVASLTMTDGNLAFAETGSATIKPMGRTSDAATYHTTISAMAPFATATGSNRTPGNLVLSIPTRVSGGNAGKIWLDLENGAWQTVENASGVTTWNASADVYQYPGAGSNYRIAATSGGLVLLSASQVRVDATNGAPMITMDTNFPIIKMENVGTSVTTAYGTGGILYVDSGALKFLGSAGTSTVLAPA